MADKAAAMSNRLAQFGLRQYNKNLTRGQKLFVWSQGKGKIFWKYAKVELRPPTLAEFPEVGTRFKQVVNTASTGKWKSIPMKTALMNFLICVEVICWFCLGEIIGKGRIVGYDVKGCFADGVYDPGYKMH